MGTATHRQARTVGRQHAQSSTFHRNIETESCGAIFVVLHVVLSVRSSHPFVREGTHVCGGAGMACAGAMMPSKLSLSQTC